MHLVEFEAHFGDQLKTVRLTAHAGVDGIWQVVIDQYYEGNLQYMNGKWVAYINENSILTADDIQLLGERIEHHYPM